MRPIRLINCLALLPIAAGCVSDGPSPPPAQVRARAEIATAASPVTLTLAPTMRDTFMVITDSAAAAASRAGSMLPRIAAHFDAGIVAKRGDDVCYRYPRYTVVQRHIVDGIAYDLLVRRAAGDAPPQQRCATDSLPGDFVVREQDAVIGMRGDTLWVESGEMISDLTLYDVSARKALIQLSQYEIVEWRDDVTVAIWQSAGKATRAQCPMVPESLYPRKDSLYLLHLATLRLEPTGAERCGSNQ